MHRSCRLAVSLVLFLSACDTVPDIVAPGPDATPPLQSKIGPGVAQALQNDGRARVMIALSSGAVATELSSEAVSLAMPRLQTELNRVQTDVLDGLGDEVFTVRRQYEMVPALAGDLVRETALATLEADPNVLRVDLDVGGTGALGGSVPVINADQRHAIGNDGQGVVVAIIDSGADSDHPDLVDDVILMGQACFGDNNGGIDGVGFCPNGSDRQFGPGAAEDDAGHGTHVSSIVSSNGTSSAVGAAPGAGILPIKVLDNCRFSGCFSAFSEIVAALDYVITNNATLGIQVINMSLGTSALFTGDCDDAAAFTMAGAAAVNTLRAMGVIIFASAGNNGSTTRMTAPACLSNVISVGAADNNDAPAGFTNSNSSTDVFAPGVGIVAALLGGGTTPASGTSMAAPHAAGCAALLIQAGEGNSPDGIEVRLETSPFSVNRGAQVFPRVDCRPLQAVIEELIAVVNGLGLPKNKAKSLVAVLTRAVESAIRGRINAVTGQLTGFIGQVNAQSGKAISPPDADALVMRAEAIVAGLR